MPVPTSIEDLSQTAASNSPAGSDAIGSSLDNYIRGVEAILRESGAALYTAAGTDTITVTTTPAFAAYFTGLRICFKAAAANTGAVTLNCNALGAKAITKNGTTALGAGDIPSGAVVLVSYDGTQFQLLAVNASYAKLDADQSWTGAQRGAITALTDAATIALDLGLSNNFVVQLGGNRTLGAPTNVVANQSGTITVLQDKTGTRTLAYAWPYVWAGGTAGVLSTPGGTEDQLVYEVRSYNSATVTMNLATPCVVTMTAHGFYHGQRIQITTTGGLYTGLTASTTYFVEVIDANSFYLCTTLANVAAGTRIATSGSQSGVHTLTGMTIRLVLNKAYA